MTADLRRVRAWVRDERSLAAALAEQERWHYDIRAAKELRTRLGDLLETMTFLLHDRSFWSKLERAGAKPLDAETVERLSRIEGSALASLLQAAGYQNPPPPPVDELVDETLAALGAALRSSHGTGRVGRAVLDQAEGALAGLLIRVRRDVSSPHTSAEDQSGATVRVASRALLSGARQLSPKLVGVAAGALMGSQVPGVDLVRDSVAAVAESGAELAVQAMAGSLLLRPERIGPVAEVPLGNPLSLHLLAAIDDLFQLDQLDRDGDYRREDPAAARQELLRSAKAHLRRLRELADDHDHRDRDFRTLLNELDHRLATYLSGERLSRRRTELSDLDLSELQREVRHVQVALQPFGSARRAEADRGAEPTFE